MNDNSGVLIAFRTLGTKPMTTPPMSASISASRSRSTRPRGPTTPIHCTGVVHEFKAADRRLRRARVGERSDYAITADGADITVALNGQVVNQFHFAGDQGSPRRGQPSTSQDPRFMGLQNRYSGRRLYERDKG